MGRIAIVTDSVANIPPDVAEAMEIWVVPLIVNIEGQEYRDGVDITPGEVYRRQRLGGVIPTTSTPCVSDFVAIYEDAAREAEEIVSLHLSTHLSSTPQAALEASSLVPGARIHVFSVPTAAMGQGFATMEAARAAARGEPVESVIARAKAVASKASVVIVIDTLEYLRRGGRIGGAAAFLGSLLNLKPLVGLVDGRVEPLGRARSTTRAVEMLLERLASTAQGRPVHVNVFHADEVEQAEELRDTVGERFDCVELLVSEFTPVMGVHTGPGAVGLAFFAD